MNNSNLQNKIKTYFRYDDAGYLVRILAVGGAKVGDRFGCTNKLGYRVGSFCSKFWREHRLIWTLLNGDIPEGLEIDHINYNKSDNRIINLRLCTHHQNSQNKPNLKKTNSSGNRGVFLYTRTSGGRPYWCAAWRDANTKQHQKYFPHTAAGKRCAVKWFNENTIRF